MYFLLVIIGILFFIGVLSIRIIPQGYNYTVEVFGRYNRTLGPGIHIIIPFVERIGAKVNMMENFLDIPSQDVITKDNAGIHVDGVVFYKIKDARMSAYEVTNVRESMKYLTMTNIRTVMGSMDLDELLSNRDLINSRLLSVIDEATDPWGVLCTRIEIKDIRPPHDLLDAMGKQMKAERVKRARILEAEGFRASEIEKAEGERMAQILKAEAYKQEQILNAEGRKIAAGLDAEARERLSEAEAYATAQVSEAISKGNKDAINYFIAQKYIEALKGFATSDNKQLVFMPTEMSSIVSFIGSIQELVQKR